MKCEHIVAENHKSSIIITIHRYLHVLVTIYHFKNSSYFFAVILVQSHLRLIKNYFVQLTWPRPATGGRQREMNVGWREWFWGEKHDSCWEGRARRDERGYFDFWPQASSSTIFHQAVMWFSSAISQFLILPPVCIEYLIKGSSVLQPPLPPHPLFLVFGGEYWLDLEDFFFF